MIVRGQLPLDCAHILLWCGGPRHGSRKTSLNILAGTKQEQKQVKLTKLKEIDKRILKIHLLTIVDACFG